MGGPGSGRWYRWQGTRTTLEEVYRLDVRWLHRHGYLDRWPRLVTWSRREQLNGSVSITLVDGRLVIEYRYRRHGTDTWEDIRQVIPLDWTPCHYGGQRPWFRCPGCQRRVAVLCGYDRSFYVGTATGSRIPANMKHGWTVCIARCASCKTT